MPSDPVAQLFEGGAPVKLDISRTVAEHCVWSESPLRGNSGSSELPLEVPVDVRETRYFNE